RIAKASGESTTSLEKELSALKNTVIVETKDSDDNSSEYESILVDDEDSINETDKDDETVDTKTSENNEDNDKEEV
ncbi:MAG: hypothetical protein GX896_01585, partial [Clostridiales bacterium]|nr:hypothetical protein [Clostridiales bacterium]